jgi:hypothetical protein
MTREAGGAGPPVSEGGGRRGEGRLGPGLEPRRRAGAGGEDPAAGEDLVMLAGTGTPGPRRGPPARAGAAFTSVPSHRNETSPWPGP